MLSIKIISSGSDATAYYANLAEAENHSYYSDDGTRPGIWWGKGAESVELGGSVTPEVFKNLLHGKSPEGDSDLVQQRTGNALKRRAGFDLTFSLPKSLSVIWSQVTDEERKQIDMVLELALHRTLDVVQELCGYTRRGKNGVVEERAELIAAVFSHDTARGTTQKAPDAFRHFHVVVPNVVVRSDGSTGTLDSRKLFSRRLKIAVGTMYRAEAAKLLSERLGIETYRPKKPGRDEFVSWWEIVGVPEPLIKAMSQRRVAIEKWLRKHGLSGAKASEKAALSTRNKKERFSWDQLKRAWQKLGREWSFGPREATRLFGNKRQLTGEQKAEQGRQAVELALKQLLDHQARFTRNDLLEQTATAAQTRGIGIDEITQAVADTLTNRHEIVRLQAKGGQTTFTTRTMLRLEKRLVDRGVRLANRTEHAVSLANAFTVMAKYPTLKPEQQEAVRQIATAGDLVAVCGIAGAGKSFVLKIARQALEGQGYRVIGTALAAKAAKGLENDSGIASTHIDKLLYELKQGREVFDDKTILVIDEAGTVGTVHMAALLERVEAAGAKVVLVGDHLQLQAVAAGAPFRLLSEAVGVTELTEIVRQQDAWARDMVRDLREGRAEPVLEVLLEKERLFIEDDHEESLDKLANDWAAEVLGNDSEIDRQLKSTLVVAGMNADVWEINERLQTEMRKHGQLGDYALEIEGQSFHLGDRVMVTKNYGLLNLQNGTTGEVTGVEGETLWLKTDDGFEVEIDAKLFPHLALGYSLSIHKCQGMTCDNAYVVTGDCMTDRELSYVSASRARFKTFLYTHEAAIESLEGLAALMSRSRQKEMAMEYELV